MKVLHVVHWPRSGIGVLLRDLIANRAPDFEHVVMCLAPGQPVTDQIRAAGAELYEPTEHVSWWASVRMLRRYTRVHQPDVIHSHSLSPRILATLSSTSVPHMTTVHAAYLYFQQTDIRSALKRSAECLSAARLSGPCICVSEDVARSLPCKTMSSRARVIVNGIDLKRIRISTNRVSRPEGAPVLVSVGRLDWEKRFDRLIQAVAEMRPLFPHIRLIICGDGVQRQTLQAQVDNLRLEEVVRLVGHVPDAAPYIRAADALVSSSVQEGFALTAVEAMAIGCPIIVTPAAGVRSILTDGETATIARGFEAADIREAIQRAFSDKDRLQRMAEAARHYTDEHLDVKHAVSAYERIYRDLFAQRSARFKTSSSP